MDGKNYGYEMARAIPEPQAEALWKAATWIIDTYNDAAFCGADMDEAEHVKFDEAIALLKKGIGEE